MFCIYYCGNLWYHCRIPQLLYQWVAHMNKAVSKAIESLKKAEQKLVDTIKSEMVKVANKAHIVEIDLVDGTAILLDENGEEVVNKEIDDLYDMSCNQIPCNLSIYSKWTKQKGWHND